MSLCNTHFVIMHACCYVKWICHILCTHLVAYGIIYIYIYTEDIMVRDILFSLDMDIKD